MGEKTNVLKGFRISKKGGHKNVLEKAPGNHQGVEILTSLKPCLDSP